MIKEKYESHTSSSTSKKATPASAYLKNYFSSDSNQKHATPISNSDSATLAYTKATYVKYCISSRSRYSKVSSRLGFQALWISTPPLIHPIKCYHPPKKLNNWWIKGILNFIRYLMLTEQFFQ